MGYLVLAIASSMLISVFMRMGETRSRNNISVLAMNYVTCTLLAALYMGPLNPTSAVTLPDGETVGLMKSLFLSREALVPTLALGLVTGVLFLGCFTFLQWNISKNGVVLSATFMKLGVLVPTIAAVTVFGERPKLMQVIGVVMAIAAILLIQMEKDSGKGKTTWGLVVLLLFGGMSDVMSKCFETWGDMLYETHYLFAVFLVAMLLALVVCTLKKQRITPVEVCFGALVGIPNYFSTLFLLKALNSIPAVVAYPTFSVGTIVMVTLFGVVIFHEKLTRRQMLALAIILAALILLNL